MLTPWGRIQEKFHFLDTSSKPMSMYKCVNKRTEEIIRSQRAENNYEPKST